ncbi:FRG domain-containing protein [Flagellimonas sediminis]|uniref:FRG domain-containing protein n=1 Tax=Flagellimonas sediminis TaxID=2696468 RepID=A0A6I5KRC1_9FLAO|nr:FRG domain-containing protein [Allomuricauda sediminis]NDV43087.1 FRG domain-containing protein [Allomuricauda sediminis]
MNTSQLKIARNIDEFLDIIKETKSNGRIWYRGMSKANRFLSPALFREKRNIGSEYSGGRAKNGSFFRKSDAIMKSDFGVLGKFKEKYDKLYPEKSEKYNIIDYLYIMQHYAIPTRLLDFSTNELVALYFSVAKDTKSNGSVSRQENEFLNNYGLSDKGSSVHCIDPMFTNEKCYGKREVINIDYVNDIDSIYNLDLPICVTTDNKDPRIKAQNGVFMLFGREYTSYDSREIFIPRITKVFIPNNFRAEIKQQLKDKFNIHHSTVYPGLKGITLEIIEDIEYKYQRDCIEVFGY